ncbi:MAG: hypothetical protein COT17_00810 [Elusimicrobia bacterium CG08_land_8_20_14_0_20_51_18]|nr:MAG: hypothetical protein COT17_00810 [Elusimicrobia bacterium CG08_land_8_20_14_0_20_51_18]
MSKIKKKAQVTVELLLVLPVFFLMLFFIMDLGLLAHKIIVVNHAAYELARVGSLLAGPKGGSSSSGSHGVDSKLQSLLCEMFTNCGQIQLSSSFQGTASDPQAGGHMNEDIVVTLVYPVKLALPGSSYFLADPPKANHVKRITVTVRMPVEKPIFKSVSN